MNTTKRNKPTILITGSEGALASWMIKNNLDGFNLIGLDSCARYNEKNTHPSYKLEIGDLCDIKWVNHMFERYRPDYVIHAAAQIYGVSGFHKYSADILGINAVSTYSVLNACKKYDVKKISYLSSSMVYERGENPPFDEKQVETLPCPHTGYGFSKLFGEKLIKEYNEQYNLNYVIWRPFNIVNPYESSKNEFGIAHVIPDMIKKIMIDQTPSVEIIGNGQQVRCFTWINDVSELICKWSWESITDCEEYNIGGETPTTITDLCKIIWEKTRKDENFSCYYTNPLKYDVQKRIPDYSKAQKTFNWKHSKSLEEMIEICINETKLNV